MAVVSPAERAAAASVTNVPRSLAAALPPTAAGWMLDQSTFGWPLVIAGTAKIVYDLLLLRQLLLARGLELLVDRPHLQQQARIRGLDRRHRAIDMELGIGSALNADVVPGIAPVVLQRIVQRGGKLGRLTHQFAQGMAEHLPRADGEQVFRRRVEVAQYQPGVDQDHGRGEQVQSAESVEMLARVHGRLAVQEAHQ